MISASFQQSSHLLLVAIQEHALSVPTMLLFFPRNFQAEMEAKELLLQQAVSHQTKLEAATRLLQGKEANLQGRLNHVMNVSTAALDETPSLFQRWQSRGGDKYRWFTLLWLGRTVILGRRIISHIHTVALNTEPVTLPCHY